MRLSLSRRCFGQGISAMVALAGCSRSDAAKGEPRGHAVRIEKFAFTPSHLTVRTGDTVVWENEDLAPHTATSGLRDWGTGKIPNRGRAAVTFDRPGEHVYVCAYHPHMRGYVRVVPGAGGQRS